MVLGAPEEVLRQGLEDFVGQVPQVREGERRAGQRMDRRGKDEQANEGPEVRLFELWDQLRGVEGLEDRRNQDHDEKGLALLQGPELEAALDADPHPGRLGNHLPGPASGALDNDVGFLYRIRVG